MQKLYSINDHVSIISNFCESGFFQTCALVLASYCIIYLILIVYKIYYQWTTEIVRKIVSKILMLIVFKCRWYYQKIKSSWIILGQVRLGQVKSDQVKSVLSTKRIQNLLSVYMAKTSLNRFGLFSTLPAVSSG